LKTGVFDSIIILKMRPFYNIQHVKNQGSSSIYRLPYSYREILVNSSVCHCCYMESEEPPYSSSLPHPQTTFCRI